MTTETTNETALTLAEAAELLRCKDHSTVVGYIKKKILKGHFLGNRYIIARSEVDRLIRDGVPVRKGKRGRKLNVARR